jgi:hypothetical protein
LDKCARPSRIDIFSGELTHLRGRGLLNCLRPSDRRADPEPPAWSGVKAMPKTGPDGDEPGRVTRGRHRFSSLFRALRSNCNSPVEKFLAQPYASPRIRP